MIRLDQTPRTALGIALASLLALPLLSLIWSTQVFAQSRVRSNVPTVIDVRRSMPLDPNEPVYHDFYINAGSEAGFKKGMYFTVVRPLPIQDPVLNKQQGTLTVTVGYVQILQVDRGITVARLHAELSDEERPALEYESVMIGDEVDTSSGTTSAPKVKAKPKPKPLLRAENEAPAVAPPPVQQVAPPAKPVTAVKLEAGQGEEVATEKASPKTAAPDMVRQTKADGSSPQPRL